MMQPLGLAVVQGDFINERMGDYFQIGPPLHRAQKRLAGVPAHASTLIDFELAHAYAGIRTLRLADGPDEVHNRSIARMEYSKYSNRERKH